MAKADRWGYDSLWHCDHFYQAFPPDPDGPCLEGWTTITALSQLTKRARIGVTVSGVDYATITGRSRHASFEF